MIYKSIIPKECHGNYTEVKISVIIMLEIGILRSSSQKLFVYWRVIFEGLGVRMMPRSLLAKTMDISSHFLANQTQREIPPWDFCWWAPLRPSCCVSGPGWHWAAGLRFPPCTWTGPPESPGWCRDPGAWWVMWHSSAWWSASPASPRQLRILECPLLLLHGA